MRCRPSCAVPMMVCIFPVMFVVILLPVFVRLHMNGISSANGFGGADRELFAAKSRSSDKVKNS